MLRGLHIALCVPAIEKPEMFSSFSPSAEAHRLVLDTRISRYVPRGAWPPVLLQSEQHSSPLDKARDPVRVATDCSQCLAKVGLSLSGIQYVAVAKGGSRTVRDALCGCSSNPNQTSGQMCYSAPGQLNRVAHGHMYYPHHCHRCTIYDLVQHGARQIIVPLRPPTERFTSLLRYQWNAYSNNSKWSTFASPEAIVAALANPANRNAIEPHIQFAWQPMLGYFRNSSSIASFADLHFVCVGDHMARHYNDAIQSFGGPHWQTIVLGETTSFASTYHSHSTPGRAMSTPSHEGLPPPANEISRIQPADFSVPAFRFERLLWQHFCLDAYP